MFDGDFMIEEFIVDVVVELKRYLKIDEWNIFVLGWLLSGFVFYVNFLIENSLVIGFFVVMSVFCIEWMGDLD